jgi:hypothetical protein
MEGTSVIASAAIGAAVATVTTLVVTNIKKKQESKETAAFVDASYTKGWYEGREVAMQTHDNVTPLRRYQESS